MKAALFGPRVTGPMLPELPIVYSDAARYSDVSIPITQIKRASRESDSSHRVAEPH